MIDTHMHNYKTISQSSNSQKLNRYAMPQDVEKGHLGKFVLDATLVLFSFMVN